MMVFVESFTCEYIRKLTNRTIRMEHSITFMGRMLLMATNGPAIKGVCGAESNGGGDCILAMKIVPPEP
jgi:hypothetical protein